ncbi:hypothetical protein PQR34_45045 [Paraburkholderia sediminicola]|uniref:hypothetical protein n=2 Tax=Paraburkholderia sediminicola TaxID=458836 RepID=UPI0038BBC1CE
MTPHTQNINQVSAVIDACSNFVAQLDAHQFGGVVFLCCLALVFAAVVVAVLVWPLLIAVSRQNRLDTPLQSTRRAPRVAGARRRIQVDR